MSTPPWGEEPQDGNPSDPQGPPANPYGPPSGQGYGQPYQPPGAYGVQGYGYAAPPATNGMAIASLITSIAGLALCCGAPSIIGAILGHVAQKQISERGEGGKGLALAGVIVGWIAFALFVVLALIYGAVIIAAINDDSYDY